MIDASNRSRLTGLASDSIVHGVRHGSVLAVDSETWPKELCEHRASFVTLQIHGRLRGCIGSLAATRPLVRDVAHHAYAAAFQDPRFHAVTSGELGFLEIHISVLSRPTPIDFDSESDLLSQIRPGEDGLVLKEGPHRATFLPDVWEKLPEPRQFVQQLKLKAGLPSDHWSDELTLERYSTESW